MSLGQIIMLALGLLIAIIGITKASRARRRENTKAREEAKDKTPSDNAKDDKAKASGGEDLPKGGFRAGGVTWRQRLFSLNGVGILLIIVAVVWLVADNIREKASLPVYDPVDVTSAVTQSDRFEIRNPAIVTSQWEPLRPLVPPWFEKSNYGGRKQFSSGEYVVEMRIGRGEPFLYGPGHNPDRPFTMEEILALELRMPKVGMYRKGYVYFQVLRQNAG